jgi:hypothetical protein
MSAGARCPVYATPEIWSTMPAYLNRSASDHAIARADRPWRHRFEAYPVEHSVLAAAVGYRIAAGGRTVFYVPDVAAIRDEAAALREIEVYVGHGATVTRSILRRSNGALIGRTRLVFNSTDAGRER